MRRQEVSKLINDFPVQENDNNMQREFPFCIWIKSLINEILNSNFLSHIILGKKHKNANLLTFISIRNARIVLADNQQ